MKKRKINFYFFLRKLGIKYSIKKAVRQQKPIAKRYPSSSLIPIKLSPRKEVERIIPQKRRK